MAGSTPSIPIGESIARARQDMRRVLRELRVPSLIAVGILAALEMVSDVLPAPSEQSAIAQQIWEPVSWVLLVYLVTPFQIAVYRLLLLGESTRGYNLAPTARLRRFCAWSLAPMLLVGVPYVLFVSTMDFGLRLVFMLLPLAALCAVLSRFMMLLPAIAIDAPGASPINAFRDSRSHGLSIFAMLFQTALTLMAVAAVIMILGPALLAGFVSIPPRGTITVFTVVFAAVWGAMMVLTYGIASCIASRLYERIGDRLKAGAPLVVRFNIRIPFQRGTFANVRIKGPLANTSS